MTTTPINEPWWCFCSLAPGPQCWCLIVRFYCRWWSVWISEWIYNGLVITGKWQLDTMSIWALTMTNFPYLIWDYLINISSLRLLTSVNFLWWWRAGAFFNWFCIYLFQVCESEPLDVVWVTHFLWLVLCTLKLSCERHSFWQTFCAVNSLFGSGVMTSFILYWSHDYYLSGLTLTFFILLLSFLDKHCPHV